MNGMHPISLVTNKIPVLGGILKMDAVDSIAKTFAQFYMLLNRME